MIIVICIIVLIWALVFALMWDANTVVGRMFGSLIIALLVGGAFGTLISMCFGIGYSADKNNCDSSTVTYELTPYEIDGEKYYAYLTNSDGDVDVSLQYYDENDYPQLLHVKGGQYLYDKQAKPFIAITSYNVRFSPFCLSLSKYEPPDEYVITIPDNSAVYQGLN